MNTEEESLAIRAAQADPKKFAYLYDAHLISVYRYFMFRTGHKQTAEDLTSQTFLQALTALPGYEVRGLPFRAWLFRIAHNLLVNHYRKPPALSLELIENLADSGKLDEKLDEKMALTELKKLIDQLPSKDQEIIILRSSADLSFVEIAETLDTTEGAARTAYHRAVQKLISIYPEQNDLKSGETLNNQAKNSQT